MHSCVYSRWLLGFLRLCAGNDFCITLIRCQLTTPAIFNRCYYTVITLALSMHHFGYHSVWFQTKCAGNIDLHTVTFLSPLKGSKYSLGHSRPPSFCWLVLFFTWTWLMFAANHWRQSLKESIQNRLFINALSSLKKMIIHLLLQDFLHGSKTGSFLAFLFEFLTCALARFFFGSFSNTLVDSREDKMLDGIPMEFSTDTSAGPWLMGLGSRSGWTDMVARKID